MRRSAAPSSLPTSKKSRFQTPFQAPLASTFTGSCARREDQENLQVPQVPVVSSSDSVTCAQSRLQEVLSKIRKTPCNASGDDSPGIRVLTGGTAKKGGHTPAGYRQPEPVALPLVEKVQTPTPGAASGHSGSASGHTGSTGEREETCLSSSNKASEDECGPRYYSVMWCKRSNKKHKTWEGDAVLIVKGNGVTLKDMDGKDIGKALGYKKSELSGLDEGSSLVIGGKQIEVMGDINREDFRSGKCFTGAVSSDTAVKCTTSSNKKFISFRGTLGGHHGQQVTPASVKPTFDPTAPGALVMPLPSHRHQLEHNPKGLELVDVVVDPHLSTHLRPHQREGVVFLYRCLMGMEDFAGRGAILADEMGLGKTLQCITLIWTFLKQGPYGLRPVAKKVLIITPGSLVKNWEREFQKWLGKERLKVYSVTADNKTEEFVKSPLYPVLIISYEMFLRVQHLLGAVNFDLVICDEGHRLKNAGAKTTSVIASLPTRRRILLTGTPIQNDLQEFYSIIDFCNPSILGSQAAFLKVYESPILLSRQPGATAEEKETGQARAKELQRLTSLFFLRRTQDVINKYLPPKVENVVFCRMSTLQLSLYKHLLNSHLVRACLHSHAHLESVAGGHSFPPHLLCIAALKKLCNSPSLIHAAGMKEKERRGGRDEVTVEEREGKGGTLAYGMEEDDELSLYSDVLQLFPKDYDPREGGVAESGCGKLAVLSEMLHQLFSTTKEKVVIVSNYTQTLDILEGFCCGRGYGCLRLDGSTPVSKRQALVERFNSKHGTEAVFLLSSKAGGVGLNLIGASRLVLYDIDWNPANDLQAMARVWRDGQKKKVHIYRLLTTGSMEEKIFQRQISKQGLNTVLDLDGCGDEGYGLDVGRDTGRGKGKGSSKWEAKFSREELRDLFSLREDTMCDTHDLLQCGCGHAKNGQRNGLPNSNSDIKTRGVDQLLDWHHYSHPLHQTSLSDDLLMGGASSTITFVFQTET